MATISVHPYEPHICQEATKLIIGTIPPYRFCTNGMEELYKEDVDFYYGSRDNYFWDLMSEITNQELQRENSKEEIEKRKALLDSLKVGIMDVVKTCIHKNKHSSDKSLNILELNSELIKEKLLEFPSINTLIYTSRFVISQMINKSISDKGYHNWISKDKMDGIIDINGKKYQVRILYSPSPSASRRVSKQKRLERYKAVFK
ncbi:MAG: hypothetical protein K2P14_01520 [Anaeroplasmataceae bacterium]|nr:hypothetical protein [Anaeroplasmataceae bacterium]